MIGKALVPNKIHRAVIIKLQMPIVNRNISCPIEINGKQRNQKRTMMIGMISRSENRISFRMKSFPTLYSIERTGFVTKKSSINETFIQIHPVIVVASVHSLKSKVTTPTETIKLQKVQILKTIQEKKTRTIEAIVRN